MAILYTLGAIFGFTFALIFTLFIITRPDKRFDLDEESYELKNQNNEKTTRTTEKERD